VFVYFNFCYHLFFSFIVKKIISEKNYVIRFYKILEPIHMFGWLTWFVGLASLTFLNYFVFHPKILG
jgi:hypothetical protein